MAALKGWRFVGFISALGGVIGLALYPIIIKPMIKIDEYKNLRKLHSWDGYKKT